MCDQIHIHAMSTTLLVHWFKVMCSTVRSCDGMLSTQNEKAGK